eukprot:TRINITY_DN42772_c0_g1_i1.p2 TRINITY_DN42772_c0_g1~~TRINITY_DN42772_c0_g1_i1.p2  ORF type:complete len:122 (-),score=9.48 TRINITY_DN42772_c0_g1_i1:101-466(-)
MLTSASPPSSLGKSGRSSQRQRPGGVRPSSSSSSMSSSSGYSSLLVSSCNHGKACTSSLGSIVGDTLPKDVDVTVDGKPLASAAGFTPTVSATELLATVASPPLTRARVASQERSFGPVSG